MPHVPRKEFANQKLMTINGQHFETGSAGIRTLNGAIEFVMPDDVFVCGWWMDINPALPLDTDGFVQAELSLSGVFKGELLTASATAGSTNVGGTLEVLTVEVDRELVTSGLAKVNTNAHLSTILPKELWIPLEKNESVYVNSKDNLPATSALNLRAGLWMFEVRD